MAKVSKPRSVKVEFEVSPESMELFRKADAQDSRTKRPLTAAATARLLFLGWVRSNTKVE